MSVICVRSGWPASVTCGEFKEMWRERALMKLYLNGAVNK